MKTNITVAEAAALVADIVIKQIADRIDKHADDMIIDYYGDKHAERFRSNIRALAETIRSGETTLDQISSFNFDEDEDED